MNNKILELWDAHLKSRFPQNFRGETVEGIDLVLLDSDVAGCVTTFIKNNGQLDLLRTAILGLCYRNLTVVIKNFYSDAEKEYFSRLETLVNLILKDLVLFENSKNKEEIN